MNITKMNYSLLFRLFTLLFIIIFSWYFHEIVLYLFLAYIISLIGKPVTASISKIRLFKYSIPRSIATVLTIIIFLIIILLSLFFFVPSLINELRVLDTFNYDSIRANLYVWISDIQGFMYEKKLIDTDQTVLGIITDKLREVFNVSSISNMITSLISSTGSFFFGVFAVLFIAFFFIKDDLKVENLIIPFFNKKYAYYIFLVMNKINDLISRYFIATLIKTFIMIALLYIGFILFGIKGALLMAFIGGITNIIPYLGPFIGWGIVSIFGMINCLSLETYADIIPLLVKISITFISVNALENLILSPFIYSHSIKAHPVEIFLVTIIGGQIGGVIGMVFGIPIYTIIRVVIIEIYNSVYRKEIIAK